MYITIIRKYKIIVLNQSKQYYIYDKNFISMHLSCKDTVKYLHESILTYNNILMYVQHSKVYRTFILIESNAVTCIIIM